MQNIRAILFDLDGTLQDSYALILASMRYATKAVLGRDIPDEVLMAKVGQPLETQMWDFTDNAETVAQICEVYREHNFRVHNDILRPFPGMTEALVRLQAAGYKMGVVTSKRHAQAQMGMDIVGVSPYMDFLVGADDCAEHKPAPGSVLYGCRLAGLTPEECMYVGDSPFDIMAGNAAGCVTVAALWGMFPRDVMEEQQPDYLFDTMAAFADMMCGE